MNVRKRNQTHFGYGPSAQHLKAVVHDACIVPEVNSASQYFAKILGRSTLLISSNEINRCSLF